MKLLNIKPQEIVFNFPQASQRRSWSQPPHAEMIFLLGHYLSLNIDCGKILCYFVLFCFSL